MGFGRLCPADIDAGCVLPATRARTAGMAGVQPACKVFYF